MKRFRSTRRSIARNGGLESEPKKLDIDSQPEQSVANAATNRDRLAYLVILLLLFIFIIQECYELGDKLAR